MSILTTAAAEDWLKSGGFVASTHDTSLAVVIAAVEAAVVRYCGRSFDKVAVDAETARVYGRAGDGDWRGIDSPTEAIVHDIHDTENLVIETDSADSGAFADTWTSDDYVLEPLNNLEGESYSPYWRIRAVGGLWFPTCNRRPALQVTAAWGWAAVPADVKQGALIKVGRLFTRKDSPQGVAGFGEFGVVRISKTTDPDVAEMLGPFRHPRLTALVA